MNDRATKIWDTKTWMHLGLLLLAAPALAEDVPATLDWGQRLTLSTPISGMVVEVSATPGQAVTKGEVLARLDERRLRAQIEGARAEVKRLQLTLEEAGRELDRNRELYERTVISARDLQLAEIDHAIAEANLAQAKANLTQLQVDLEDSRVRAPFDGLVLERHVQPGETVVNRLNATPMITIAARGVMTAHGGLTAEQLARVRPGMQLGVQVGGERYSGRVERLATQPTQMAGEMRYEIIVRFEPSTALQAGQPATLQLP